MLQQHGPNQLSIDRPKSWLYFFLASFRDEFILVLIALGFISFLLDDSLGGSIIFLLAFISAMMRFTQDYSAYKASLKLKTMTSFSKSSAMISRPLLAWTIFSRTGRMS